MNGLNVTHHFGGANAAGGRHAIEGNLFQSPDNFGFGATAGDNPDRFYVGVQGQVISWTGDGGTGVADRKGAYFGMSTYAELRDDAHWVDNLTGNEVNTVIQEPLPGQRRIGYHAGIQIASHIGDRGFTSDSAIAISCLGGSPLGWGVGILFGGMNGRNPFDLDSTVMSFGSFMNVNAGIDFRNGSFVEAPFMAQNLSLRGDVLQADAPNAHLNLGATSGGPTVAYIDFFTGNATRSARIIAPTANHLRVTDALFEIESPNGLFIQGTRVIGPRLAAIPNTDATPENIAAVVNDILSKLRAHGLIET